MEGQEEKRRALVKKYRDKLRLQQEKKLSSAELSENKNSANFDHLQQPDRVQAAIDISQRILN